MEEDGHGQDGFGWVAKIGQEIIWRAGPWLLSGVEMLVQGLEEDRFAILRCPQRIAEVTRSITE
jgi:hypothetical protein